VELRSFSQKNIRASLAVDALFFILKTTFVFRFNTIGGTAIVTNR